MSPSLNTTADGSLYFTVLDVAKWDAALYTDTPLSARIREQMWTPAKFGKGATTSLKLEGESYGCGWFLDTMAGHLVVEHSGSWQGFQTFIVRCLDDGLTVVVLCNLAPANPEAIAHGVARRSLPALKGHPIADADPMFSAFVADVFRSAAAGSLNPEWFTDEARKEQVTRREQGLFPAAAVMTGGLVCLLDTPFQWEQASLALNAEQLDRHAFIQACFTCHGLVKK